jgi:hypothetical protein
VRDPHGLRVRRTVQLVHIWPSLPPELSAVRDHGSDIVRSWHLRPRTTDRLWSSPSCPSDCRTSSKAERTPPGEGLRLDDSACATPHRARSARAEIGPIRCHAERLERMTDPNDPSTRASCHSPRTRSGSCSTHASTRPPTSSYPCQILPKPSATMTSGRKRSSFSRRCNQAGVVAPGRSSSTQRGSRDRAIAPSPVSRVTPVATLAH